MADKRCENGHFIDETWDLCPYCPQDASDPDLPIIRPRGGDEGSPGDGFVPRTSPPMTMPPMTMPPMTMSPSSSIQAPPMERTVALGKAAAPGGVPEVKRFVVAWLVGLSGDCRGESYAVRMGRNVLGRDGRSDVVVNDDQASSHHADLVYRPEERRFILMDHNSTNGTYVDEAEIEPRKDLSGREVIRIGSHRYLFVPLCGEGVFWGDEGLLK